MKLSKEELQHLLEEGKTHQEIANVVGVSRRTIGNWCKKYDLKSNYSKKLEKVKQLDKKVIALEYINDGKSTEELGQKYSVHKGTIGEWIRSEGYELRDASQSKRIYQFNENYFSKIDSREKAYILGFISADGYLFGNTVLGFTISKKDEAIIDFIIKEMEITNPKRYFSRKLQNERIGEYVEVRVGSLITHKDLNLLGLTNNKTLTLNLESIAEKAGLDNELLKSFILGYFDGDGGIYHYNKPGKTEQFSLSITGTKETCDFLLRYSNTGFIVKRHDNNTNNYTFQIGGRNMVKSFLLPLYESAPKFYLERKHNIFLKL